MLSLIILNVVMLSVIILNVIMLNVMAPRILPLFAVKNKNFIRITPGPYVIKHFTPVIYEFRLSSRVFVPGRHFQPSVMFVSKARSLP